MLGATVVLTQPGCVASDAVKVSWDGAVVAGNWTPVQPVPKSAMAAPMMPCAAWKFKSRAPVALDAAGSGGGGSAADADADAGSGGGVNQFIAEFGEGAIKSVGRVPAPAACSITVAVPTPRNGGGAGAAVANVGGASASASALRRALARYIIPSEELLAGQLEACKELLEELDEGGEKKWALLAIVYILNGLGGAAEQRAEIYDAVGQLKAIDSSRRRYYDDLRSRYVCEDMICAAGGAATDDAAADWSGKELTTMCHTQFLALAAHVNLSNNMLRRLDGFGVLLNVHTLNLDNNSVEGIFSDELKGMKALKVLHLQNNQISTLRGLDGLKRVQLDQLLLTGNPVVQVEGFDEIVQALAGLVGV